MNNINPIYIKPNKVDKELTMYNEIFKELLELNWLEVKDARKELFMSDIPRIYKYGNMDYEYKSIPFSNAVYTHLMELNIFAGYNLNVCFLNRYDNQNNALGWHSDDSEEIDQSQPIVVISYGAEREIWWKEKDYKGVIPNQNKKLLEHGSIFIMPSGFQDKYYHKIPKNDKPCETRISLTFRRF